MHVLIFHVPSPRAADRMPCESIPSDRTVHPGEEEAAIVALPAFLLIGCAIRRLKAGTLDASDADDLASRLIACGDPAAALVADFIVKRTAGCKPAPAPDEKTPLTALPRPVGRALVVNREGRS